MNGYPIHMIRPGSVNRTAVLVRLPGETLILGPTAYDILTIYCGPPAHLPEAPTPAELLDFALGIGQ